MVCGFSQARELVGARKIWALKLKNQINVAWIGLGRGFNFGLMFSVFRLAKISQKFGFCLRTFM
jgi:hypothetical protein